MPAKSIESCQLLGHGGCGRGRTPHWRRPFSGPGCGRNVSYYSDVFPASLVPSVSTKFEEDLQHALKWVVEQFLGQEAHVNGDWNQFRKPFGRDTKIGLT